MADAFILCTDGLYYEPDLDAPSASLKQAFTGGKLVRRVAGVANAAAVLQEEPFTDSYTDNLTAGLGAKSLMPIANGFLQNETSDATWSATGGRTDNGGCITEGVGQTATDSTASLVIDLEDEYTLTAASFWHIQGAAGESLTRVITRFNRLKEDAANLVNVTDLDSSTSYQQVTWTGTAEDTRYILLSSGTVEDGGTNTSDDFSVSWSGKELSIQYTDDNGDTLSPVLLGRCGDTYYPAFDADDHNAGVLVAALGSRIAYTSAYNQATADELSGLTGLDGIAKVTCVRIPYRKLATQALNSNATLMQFIYGVDAAVSGKTLWGITFNASTGAIAAQSNMTPIVNGTTYYVIGPNALVTNGDITQQIIALCKPVGGGATRILASNDGGNPNNWQDRGAFNGLYADIVPAADGGENGEYLVSGTGGLRHAASFNSSLQNRDGDAGSELAEDILGMIAL